eukprot:CAMPEP_0197022646 /NCGR_PEP_ID=MMETSP1384-20130603/3461_1 /TAXON_ID=29189 /ORGANISM="Ammonia sp." /LENGTH=363 /DNA_ID=CAMNT_0042450719 /DNA_START=23 /DNA_END=1114 /DNA_ORIENTATION=-
MAQSTEPGDGKQKKKGKFGMMVSVMARKTKEGTKKMGQQMAKGTQKMQAKAAKMSGVRETPEDPEVTAALQRLKITKNEIEAISKTVRELYESRMFEASFMVQLATKLKETQTSQNDPFSQYVQKMGVGLAALEQVSTEHLKRMEEELVVPLEKFRDTDIAEIQKLKVKYYKSKTAYDSAVHKLAKAQESNDQQKITTAEQHKDGTAASLNALRTDLKFQVNNLEQKKQVNLLGCMEQYWQSYSAYASATSNILSKNTIEKANFVMPTSPGQPVYTTDMLHLNNNEEMKAPDQEYGNPGNETPPPPQEVMTSNGMPPPPQAYANPNDDGNYYNDNNQFAEYDDVNVEENRAGPSDEYNPFDED